MSEREAVLSTVEVYKEFEEKTSFLDLLTRKKGKSAKVLENVNLDFYENRIVGIVGESGCGKSTLAKCIIGLEKPSSGELRIGRDIKKTDIQMVFQDPYSSLNPRMTIYDTLKEVLTVHKSCKKKDMPDKIYQLMVMCGLDRVLAERYPGELSGGQRQRVGIARALAADPKILIADEPVSALDVSIQAQIINLLAELKQKLKLTIIFISHDLNVVRYISDVVAVMYLGTIVEYGKKEDIYTNPLHPYTKLLLDSAPRIDADAEPETTLLELGELPTPYDRPKGCCFHTRCPYATECCRTTPIGLVKCEGSHEVACFRYYFGEK